jgi:hypothetical protein
MLTREERVAATANLDAELRLAALVSQVVPHDAQCTVASTYSGWIFVFILPLTRSGGR